MVESPVDKVETNLGTTGKTIEQILSKNSSFSHIKKIQPELIDVLEVLKQGYLNEKDKRYFELWIRGFDLLDGLASDPNNEFEEELDSDFIRNFIEGDIKSAMKASLAMRDIDLWTIDYMKTFNSEDMAEYEIDFYEMIHQIMDPQELNDPNIHNFSQKNQLRNR